MISNDKTIHILNNNGATPLKFIYEHNGWRIIETDKFYLILDEQDNYITDFDLSYPIGEFISQEDVFGYIAGWMSMYS